MDAYVIPPVGPIETIVLDGTLKQLQDTVGGYIEAVPLPSFIPGAEKATAYLHGEGKFNPSCEPNMRATDFMVPGIGLLPGDYIAGTMLVCGFDITTGEHADVPEGVVRRIRLIEKEAGS